jgi:hypothetical protein
MVGPTSQKKRHVCGSRNGIRERMGLTTQNDCQQNCSQGQLHKNITFIRVLNIRVGHHPSREIDRYPPARLLEVYWYKRH